MRGERVAEQVRINFGVDTLAAGPVIDTSLHTAATEACAPVADEQGSLVGVGELLPRYVPFRQCLQCT
jgi:hypothetical protein